MHAIAVTAVFVLGAVLAALVPQLVKQACAAAPALSGRQWWRRPSGACASKCNALWPSSGGCEVEGEGEPPLPGFPSGHTCFAAYVAVAAWMCCCVGVGTGAATQWTTCVLAAAVVVAVGVARISAECHTWGQVAAGAVTGATIATAVTRAALTTTR